MTPEEYRETVEQMMKDFASQITALSLELKEYKDHNEKLVTENNYLKNEARIREVEAVKS